MNRWVEIAFDCLPLRSVGRLDIPIDASPKYRERCEQMRRATHLGMVSAIFLLVALLCGGANVLFPNAVALKYAGATCILLGLLSVIGAAVYVLRENSSIRRALEAELATLPDLAAPGAGKSTAPAVGAAATADRRRAA